MTKTKVWSVWRSMMRRCYEKTATGYHRYGGRGLRVCDDWHTFENFFADMGHPPPGHQLDREENDGNYEPGNCRWVLPKVNMRNRSNNKRYEFQGKSRSIAEIAEMVGLPRKCLEQRLRHGVPFDQAVSTPVENHETLIVVDGKEMNVSDAAKLYGLKPYVLNSRIVRGWPLEEALKTPTDAKSRRPRGTKPSGKIVEARGEAKTIGEWSATSGVHASVIRGRLANEWPPEAAIFAPVGSCKL